MKEVIQIRCFFFISLLLLVSLNCSSVFAEDAGSAVSSASPQTTSSLPSSIFDIRIRPIAALQATPGAEFSFALTPRLEIGPTFHYFNGTDTFRNSTLRTFELGIKATYIIWERFLHEGIYFSGAFYDYISDVGNDSVQPNYSSGNFSTLGYTLTAGYQWDLGQTGTWTFRLGAGLGYGQEHFQSVSTQGRRAPINNSFGVLSQLEPTLECTFGFWI